MKMDEPKQVEDLVFQANIDYHNRIAEQYESDVITALLFAPRLQGVIESIVKLLQARTEGRVWVDVGCGTGNVLKFADHHFGQAVGFDISAGMLRLSRQRALQVGFAGAQDLPVASGTADVVSAFSVLHHLFDPKPALAEAYRVLKPGGYLYSDFDPNGQCLARQPLLRTLVRRVYTWYREVVSHTHATEKQAADLVRLQYLAEYHHNYTTGLNPRHMMRLLRELGFREVNVYLSFETLDPARLTQGGGMPAAVAEWVAPMFAIVARK